MPDVSTLCRRQCVTARGPSGAAKARRAIAVQLSSRRAQGPLSLRVDSSGIKFLGDGEWLARKHGTQRRRRDRKVHLAMDPATDDIRAAEFTSGREGDSPVLPDLLAQSPENGDLGTVAGELPADAPSPIGLGPMAPRWARRPTARSCRWLSMQERPRRRHRAAASCRSQGGRWPERDRALHAGLRGRGGAVSGRSLPCRTARPGCRGLAPLIRRASPGNASAPAWRGRSGS